METGDFGESWKIITESGDLGQPTACFCLSLESPYTKGNLPLPHLLDTQRCPRAP